MNRRVRTLGAAGLAVAAAGAATMALTAQASPAIAARDAAGRPATLPGGYQHLVVIYEENHSFDNLYGGWPKVEGRGDADPAHTTQVSQDGTPYKQEEVDLIRSLTGAAH